MNFDTIMVTEPSDGVLAVTLNRPQALNSFTDQMCREFAQLWEMVRLDTAVRAIVLRAAGDRAFSTGVDVRERLGTETAFGDPERPWDELSDSGRWLSPKRNEVWKPVIAAVHGMCAGGAAYWIAECDIVICEPDATFFDPHVTYGMVAALEPILLSYRMLPSDALRMALLGGHERIGAERALATGLVTEIVARDHLWDRADELARVIASQPAIALQGTLKAFWQSLNAGRDQALQTALMFTQIGNPLATAGMDRDAAKPAAPWIR